MLMLITPGCTTDDRVLAAAVLDRELIDAQPVTPQTAKRRWWQRG